MNRKVKKIDKHLNRYVLIDAFIRLITIATRGMFVFAAAKYLEGSDFGYYIAIGASISLLQYFVAGDYSYITHRELFADRLRLEEILGAQVPLLSLLFLASIPLLIILLPLHIEMHLIILAAAILFFESATSELQRHLVAISKFTRANLLLFLKSAGWMMPTLCLFYLDNKYRSIDTLLIAWTVGLGVSLSLGLFGIPKNITLQWSKNKRLLFKYFAAVPNVLVGTIATRSLFSVDRIVVEKFVGLEMVGVYGLYVGISAAFVAILDAGVLTRSYPGLVTSAVKDPVHFNSISKRIRMQIIGVTIFAIAVYYMTIEIFLRFISKSGMTDYSNAGALLILAYGVYSLSFPLNCKLYALGHDKSISLINVVSLLPLSIAPLLGDVTIYNVVFMVIGCASSHYLLRYIFQLHLNRKSGN